MKERLQIARTYDINGPHLLHRDDSEIKKERKQAVATKESTRTIKKIRS